MSAYNMLVSIVPHDKGENLTAEAVKAGSGGGTVIMARGLASSNLMAVLGLGETTKDIVLMIVESGKKKTIIDAIKKSCSNEKTNFGQLFSIDVASLMKTGVVTGEDGNMNTEKSRDIISVIVNKGYADDAMAAARKAGAGGGTVISARGTAREDDEKFFGVHIVPEKEMLMIIVEHDKKNAVLESIKGLKCLSEPGSGIAFCSGIDDFNLLGKKKS